MIVRKANYNDLKDLVCLYNQLIDYQNIVINSSVELSYKKILELDNYYILVVEEGKIVVSTCTLVIVPNLTHNQRPYAIIENVVTDLNHRGLGYATAVIDNAKSIAISNNCHKILVQTRSKKGATLQFYEKNGFNKNETTGFQINIEREEENERFD